MGERKKNKISRCSKATPSCYLRYIRWTVCAMINFRSFILSLIDEFAISIHFCICDDQLFWLMPPYEHLWIWLLFLLAQVSPCAWYFSDSVQLVFSVRYHFTCTVNSVNKYINVSQKNIPFAYNKGTVKKDGGGGWGVKFIRKLKLGVEGL